MIFRQTFLTLGSIKLITCNGDNDYFQVSTYYWHLSCVPWSPWLQCWYVGFTSFIIRLISWVVPVREPSAFSLKSPDTGILYTDSIKPSLKYSILYIVLVAFEWSIFTSFFFIFTAAGVVCRVATVKCRPDLQLSVVIFLSGSSGSMTLC